MSDAERRRPGATDARVTDARVSARAVVPPPAVGLALAGGGPAGAVYEIGALRALDEALEGVDLAALPHYVGVSAGAFLAACLANGMSPALLVRHLAERVDGEPAFEPDLFFTPAYGEFARRALRLPMLVGEALWQYGRAPGDQTLRASLARVAGVLPTALFDNEPIRRYLADVFRRVGRTDDFRVLRALGRRLVCVAADLETGRAVRLGAPGDDDVPISRAVQASTAVPGLYPAVEVHGRPLVDGVLLKTVHASVALDAGARLVLCVNPIVPADVAAGVRTGQLPRRFLRASGLPTVLSQTFRTLVHSRLEVGMAAYAERYPDADVVLFEPARDDYAMVFGNVFSFRARRAVCELAYRATRRDLRARADRLEPILARHGITLRRDVLDAPDADLWAGAGVEAPPPELPRPTRERRRMPRAG